MSGKYNTQHPARGNSNYPNRLRARGETNVTVRMAGLDQLRQWQGAYAPAEIEHPEFNGKRNNWRRRDEG